MQTAAFITALFAVVVSVIGVDQPELLRIACGVGGVLFLVIAYLGYRLGRRQDDCEDTLAEIESLLRAAGCDGVVSLRRGAGGFGARKLLILFIVAVGILLLSGAILGVPVTQRPQKAKGSIAVGQPNTSLHPAAPEQTPGGRG
jgi:hypothetical protein